MEKESDEQRGKKLYALKKQLQHLKSMRGSGTELISVYIPAGAPIHETSTKLKGEAGQASNIKSKGTRKNVVDALERIVQHLKIYGNSAPGRGLAIFCGNVSDNPARTDIEIFAIEPPEPIHVSIYRCDSDFFLEPLQAMLDVKEKYGLVVLDGRECTIAMLRGTNVQILKRMNSTAHQKIRKGGQSSRRFERLIEESIELYYKRIGEAMDQHFVNTVKGVIVGGPGPTKENFVKMSPFNYQIKILGVVDTGYTDEYGIRETMAKSGGIIAQQDAIVEKQIVDKFIRAVVSGGLAAYGENEVRQAITSKQAELALVSEGLTQKRVKLRDTTTGEENWITVKGDPDAVEEKIKSIGGTVKIVEEKLLIDEMMELAEAKDVPIRVISNDTPEGAQFLQSFYGLGAFLRYR